MSTLDLDGISVALITPWHEDGGIDWRALERLVEHDCDAGVVAVSPAGTTGEGPRLTRDQRVELTRRCVELVPSGVGAVAGIVSTSLTETLDELEAVASAGADAALVTPPTRMPLGAEGCLRFYTAIADRSPLPIVMYHIPSVTCVGVPAEVIPELAGHPSIAGLKDSSGDLQYHLRLVDSLVDSPNGGFALLTGSDTMLVASMQAGSAGAITASANLVPELGVAVHRAVRDGDLGHALELQRRLRAVVFACRRGELPAGWKAALELTGRASALPVPPGQALDPAQVRDLRADLERAGVIG